MKNRLANVTHLAGIVAGMLVGLSLAIPIFLPITLDSDPRHMLQLLAPVVLFAAGILLRVAVSRRILCGHGAKAHSYARREC